MKLPQTKLKLKLKAGGLSKSEKQALLQATTKTKPLASREALGAEITSKPIIVHQIHATNRQRRALRRSSDVSHLQQTPLVPTLSKPPRPSPPVDAAGEVKGKMWNLYHYSRYRDEYCPQIGASTCSCNRLQGLISTLCWFKSMGGIPFPESPIRRGDERRCSFSSRTTFASRKLMYTTLLMMEQMLPRRLLLCG